MPRDVSKLIFKFIRGIDLLNFARVHSGIHFGMQHPDFQQIWKYHFYHDFWWSIPPGSPAQFWASDRKHYKRMKARYTKKIQAGRDWKELYTFRSYYPTARGKRYRGQPIRPRYVWSRVETTFSGRSIFK